MSFWFKDKIFKVFLEFASIILWLFSFQITPILLVSNSILSFLLGRWSLPLHTWDSYLQQLGTWMPSSNRDANCPPGNQLPALNHDPRCSYQYLGFLIKFNIIIGFLFKAKNHFSFLTIVTFSLNKKDWIIPTTVTSWFSKSC